MNERREFLKGTLATAAALAVSKSGISHASYNPFAGIIYTNDAPGMWSSKVGSHAPIVERKGDVVTITTKHPMSEEHFIVRHTLVLADGLVAGSHTFKPTDKEAVSVIDLPTGYDMKFYATSFCNLHDFWVTESM